MMSDNEDLLRTAAEQFLGKGEQEIEDTIIQVHLIIYIPQHPSQLSRFLLFFTNMTIKKIDLLSDIGRTFKSNFGNIDSRRSV